MSETAKVNLAGTFLEIARQTQALPVPVQQTYLQFCSDCFKDTPHTCEDVGNDERYTCTICGMPHTVRVR